MVLPLDGGRPVTKSTAMCDQGREGTDSGWSSPAGGRLELLPAAKIEQVDTNWRASIVMNGHKNRCLVNIQVRVGPGWQASLDEWPHCRMLIQIDSGTNNRLSGHPAGTPYSRCHNYVPRGLKMRKKGAGMYSVVQRWYLRQSFPHSHLHNQLTRWVRSSKDGSTNKETL